MWKRNNIARLSLDFACLAKLHKNISRKLKFVLSRYPLDIFVLHKYDINNDTFRSQLGSTKTFRPYKYSSILPICIKHMVKDTTPRVQKCMQNIANVMLRVFEFALAEFCAKFVKIGSCQSGFFHFYSNDLESNNQVKCISRCSCFPIFL